MRIGRLTIKSYSIKDLQEMLKAKGIAFRRFTTAKTNRKKGRFVLHSLTSTEGKSYKSYLWNLVMRNRASFAINKNKEN